MPPPLAPALEPRQPVGAAATCGLEERGAQPPRAACRQGQGQATRATIIASVAPRCLGPRRAGLGVIDRAPDDRGWTVVGRDPWLQQPQSHAGQRGA